MENVLANRKSTMARIALTFVCTLVVIAFRVIGSHSLVRIGGFFFSFTDFCIIITAGIGGMAYAMTSFASIFLASLVFNRADFHSVFSLFIYLTEIYFAAFFARNRSYRSVPVALLPFAAFEIALAVLWEFAFGLIFELETKYGASSLPRLLLCAFPEVFLAVALQFFYFRAVPDGKESQPPSVLAFRLAFMSALEAILLCAVAIAFYCLNDDGKKSIRDTIEISMMFLSATIPFSYLFNALIKRYVIYPLNAMAFLMDKSFSERGKGLSDIESVKITTGDEIEGLFKSLQRMVGDMTSYSQRILEQENRAKALTEGFMTALTKVVDEKDHYTSGHSVRVAKYAREIARRMKKSADEQQQIYYIGLVHDIGKIGITGAIINKKSSLDDEEYREMKEHTMKGYFILKNVSEMPSLAVGARWHHERYDGTGYPDGLRGKEIPEIARIIAVADTYDAMTSRRSYSVPKDRNTVREEIIKQRGKQFDPHIANILVEMIDDGTVNFL